MKLSIIIPNYNGEKILKKNLPKVLESLENLKHDCEIIISDDASGDLSVSIIKEFLENNKNHKVELKLIENTLNKGFASNVNKGVESANGDLLVLLNTDVIPMIDFLDPIIPHFSDEKVFGVGCMDESIENEKKVLRGRGKGKWKKGFLMHSRADIDGKETLWVSGGSGVFRKSIWDSLGGLDSLYDPFYWEDIDLSYRAKKSGFKTLFENKSIVRHEHEKGAIKSKYSAEDVKKIAYRNQFIFTWKNSDLSTLIISLIWLPYHLLNAVRSGDKDFIRGFILALKMLKNIMKKRDISKKQFIFTDKKVTGQV
jgi:GT2 family glycosyltransferase